ncbi:hypothetical protein [Gallionella capsiferriformans]|jgi:hypothetical protein|uniref:Uncharacterized protein n=1 Tax=Gallionella capsiferriformans (strain ES-2) TaxID=395494 RepID=D9SFS7_GALCS|nr:hypothetical protein [Gallionella capsiferriformans]ADL55374.1 hypothetical protein Galf_1348 [Gallionella capsiferriformans ES-2]
MNTPNRRALFEHYCASMSSFHHTPTFADYSAGIDAGMAYMQAEMDELKRQLVSLRYSQKTNDDGGNRLATLEALNKALIHTLSEINVGK